ncbi:conserved hypothetical protein [delta proteobacterium NaphS2]|nr:conserved hypothetical protein [delta proteobacterium NaphS2]
MTAKVKEWGTAVPIPKRKSKNGPVEPDVEKTVESLAPFLKEFAKLDGYNVWRRSLEINTRDGKLTTTDEGELKREPMRLSWIVPVRQWAELESWGEDPESKEPIARPTHREGVIDPEYHIWLRDELKIFDNDGTVKKDFLDRLDPDCIEALDFNLSAGRHKPFVFDPGEHRPPAEIIGELQAIHEEVQMRLGKLLEMVGGGNV